MLGHFPRTGEAMWSYLKVNEDQPYEAVAYGAKKLEERLQLVMEMYFRNLFPDNREVWVGTDVLFYPVELPQGMAVPARLEFVNADLRHGTYMKLFEVTKGPSARYDSLQQGEEVLSGARQYPEITKSWSEELKHSVAWMPRPGTSEKPMKAAPPAPLSLQTPRSRRRSGETWRTGRK